MRWESLTANASGGAAGTGDALFAKPAVMRTFDSPQFAGMTFFEVHAKSILNSVPAAAGLPFSWTINPYRGCSHACRYCFARNTHTYLELGAGLDFDTKVVVKVNAPALLRDLPLLQRAAQVTDVSTAVSVGFVDASVWRHIEPGTPSPSTRLRVCR